MSGSRRGDPPRRRAPHAVVGAVGLVVLALTAAIAPATPVAPACSFSAALTATPSGGSTPLLVRLNATVSSGTPTEFEWGFGDGSFWNASGESAATPLHRYASPGTFPVSVTAVESGCGATATATVIVTPGPVVVAISATPTSGTPPLRVHFNISITGGTGTYASTAWAFGDGGAGLGTALEYTYERAGRYTATVTVRDSAGDMGNASVVISAQSPPSSAPGWVPWAVGGAAAVVALGAVAGWTWRRPRPDPVREDGPIATRAPAATGGAPGTASPQGDRSGTDIPPPPASSPENRSPDPGATSAVAGVPTIGTPPAERRQLSRAVLLHIGAQGRLAGDEVAPVGLTQSGMAQSLGVGQNSLTNVLRRLVAAGVLDQDVRHVRGQARRLRVYRLTGRGESLYQDLRRRRDPGTGPPPD